MKFKTEELKEQYWKMDSRLRVISLSVCAYVRMKYGYEMTVTEIERTQEKQDYYYRNNLKYQKKKWFSVHQMRPCRGLDFRMKDMDKYMIDDIYNFVKMHFVYTGPRETGLVHGEDEHKHLHLQVDPDGVTELMTREWK